MTIPNEQLANAYAFAMATGCKLSFEEFEKSYTQYYEEAIQTLASRPVESATSVTVDSPM